MALELHVAHDVRPKRARDMGESGATEAGIEFFGDSRSADLRVTLKHEWLVSGLREIKSSDQPVVAATDDDDIACLSHLSSPLMIFQDLERCQSAVGTHDATTGMGGRAAHVEILNGCPELRPARNRPQKEELLQRQLTLKDVALRQAKFSFEIESGYDLFSDDD